MQLPNKEGNEVHLHTRIIISTFSNIQFSQEEIPVRIEEEINEFQVKLKEMRLVLELQVTLLLKDKHILSHLSIKLGIKVQQWKQTTKIDVKIKLYVKILLITIQLATLYKEKIQVNSYTKLYLIKENTRI